MAGWDTSMQEALSEPVGILGIEDKQEVREKKVNKKRLEELEANNKTLEFWTTDAKTRAKMRFDRIPLDCAAICCDAIFKAKLAAEKKGEKLKLLEIFCSTDSEMEAYRYVLKWVKSCGRERSVVDVTPLPFTDQKDWQLLSDIVVVADKLEIPAASFGKHLLKKSKSMAQDVLPDLDFVAELFDSDEGVPELGHFAASVIFEAWYNWKLDAEEYDDYMARLQQLRVEKSALDEALNAAVQDKDDFIKRMREKKRIQDQENSGAQGDSGFNNDGENSGTGFDGTNADWPQQDNQNNVAYETPSWDTGNAGSDNKPSWEDADNNVAGGNGTANWADDANEAANNDFTPNPEPVSANW